MAEDEKAASAEDRPDSAGAPGADTAQPAATAQQASADGAGPQGPPPDDQAQEPGAEQATEQSPMDKNTVTIEEVGPCRKKVTIEVPPETITSVLDRQYSELRRDAVVPGFRRGRAPRRLLEKRFGKEISEQAKLKLLSDASEAALKDIQTLGEPDLDPDKVELPEQGPLKFDFEVDVRPRFDLPSLEGIPITRTRVEITDEHIDREIEQMRRLAGIWSPRQDGPVELNDQVIAEVELRTEPQAQAGTGAEAEGEDRDREHSAPEHEKLGEIEVYVRPNGFVGMVPVEKLDQLLVGARLGEKKQTTVEVPKTHFAEQYRGKKVDISIEIKDIKYLKPAELDAAFFERFGVEDEDELRERVHDRLHDQLEQQARDEMTEQIFNYLRENTDFDLPDSVVAEQAGALLRRQYAGLLARGLSQDQIAEHMEQLRGASESQAREQLKTFFIMDHVADKLGIEVNEEEINGRIAQLALRQGQRPERMREQMARDGSLAQFTLEVRQSKCIEKLLESAEITEIEPEKKKPAGRAERKKKASQPAGKTAQEAKTPPEKQTGD